MDRFLRKAENAANSAIAKAKQAAQGPAAKTSSPAAPSTVPSVVPSTTPSATPTMASSGASGKSSGHSLTGKAKSMMSSVKSQAKAKYKGAVDGSRAYAQDVKDHVLQKEHRHSIIQKLNRGDVHYAPEFGVGSGSWCSDWWFHIKNNHLELSIFCAHPEHPFSRFERLTVFFISIFVAFLLAASWEYIDDPKIKYYAGLIGGTIIIMVYSLASRACAQCKCVQSDNCPVCVRESVEACGTCMLFGCMCHACVLLGIAIYLVGWDLPRRYDAAVDGTSPSSSDDAAGEDAYDSRRFTANFIGSKCISIALQPLTLTATFAYYRYKEMKRDAQKAAEESTEMGRAPV